jgi:GNAT superfamily N-acetyltransferase
MEVRRAKPSDVEGIVDLGRAMCSKSPSYAGLGFNAAIWRRSIKDSMRDQHQRVFVVETDNGIEGVLIGMIYPMAWTHGFVATDTVFAARRGGKRLIEAFIRWAKAIGVRRIDMGRSEPGQRGAAFKLYTDAGLIPSGEMFYQITEEAKK